MALGLGIFLKMQIKVTDRERGMQPDYEPRMERFPRVMRAEHWTTIPRTVPATITVYGANAMSGSNEQKHGQRQSSVGRM